MDDGFILWPKSLDINIFITILGKLDKSIKYTVEKGKVKGTTQEINMLDIKVILHGNERFETEIYYKLETTIITWNIIVFTRDTMDNIPYNLAKRIIIFTSDSNKESKELERLRKWLTNSNYPKKVINRAFHNAKLQGLAPNPKDKKSIIPLVRIFCSNYSNTNVVKRANSLLEKLPR